MSVELKILVPYEEWQLLKKIAKTHESCSGKSTEEWEKLRAIEKQHQKCQTQLGDAKHNNLNNLSTIKGTGTCIDESGDYRLSDFNFVMPSANQNQQQNIDRDINSFEKNVIVDKAAKVLPESNPIQPLAKSDIIQHIQEKFKNDAIALLDTLAGHPSQFSFDSNGILSIFGTSCPGNCAFNLILVV